MTIGKNDNWQKEDSNGLVSESVKRFALPRRVIPIRSPSAARSTISENFCFASNSLTVRKGSSFKTSR
jgi:hypothetical protein